MNYTLTVADVATLIVLAIIILMLVLHWPNKESPDDIDTKVHKFTLGVDAVRMDWDRLSNEHEIQINLRRPTDTMPGVGNMVVLVEEGGNTLRGKVVRVRQGPLSGKVTIIVVPFIRGYAR